MIIELRDNAETIVDVEYIISIRKGTALQCKLDELVIPVSELNYEITFKSVEFNKEVLRYRLPFDVSEYKERLREQFNNAQEDYEKLKAALLDKYNPLAKAEEVKAMMKQEAELIHSEAYCKVMSHQSTFRNNDGLGL